MKPLDQCWPIAEAVGLATILEASAPKLGNVHPGASFPDMHYGHFVASAAAVGAVFRDVHQLSVGQLVLASIQETRVRVGCNTNLGTVLLLAPLAKAAWLIEQTALKNVDVAGRTADQHWPGHGEHQKNVGHCRTALQRMTWQVLQSLNTEDSRLVYEAIRLAQPGGLGEQESNDIKQAAPLNLVDAMQQVADVDAVARQYVNRFEDVFERLLPWLDEALKTEDSPLNAIVRLQLRVMAWEPDGLIVRKCGLDRGRQIQAQAQQVLFGLDSGQAERNEQLERFDQLLRSEGNRLNPGTTADLIAATLFCRLVSQPEQRSYKP